MGLVFLSPREIKLRFYASKENLNRGIKGGCSWKEMRNGERRAFWLLKVTWTSSKGVITNQFGTQEKNRNSCEFSLKKQLCWPSGGREK